MTTPVHHCYRHVLRSLRQAHARRPFVSTAAAIGTLVALCVLAPAGISGGGDHRPVPVIMAAPGAPGSRPAAAVNPIDPLLAALAECPYRVPPRERERWARIISAESTEHGYDPLFITALMQVESGCLPTANGNGAIGLVQLLPSTARAVARRIGIPWRGERTLTEVSSNIQLGLHYLREMEELLGDPYRAVAAFNLGPVRVARMSSGRARQTIYVRKILSRYERLLDQYT